MKVLTNLADDELLRLMASKNEQAFTVLYQRRQRAVYRFALQMSGSPSVAEETTQEVFLILLHEGSGYDPARGPLASYLYGVARRLVWRRMAQDRTHVQIGEEALAFLLRHRQQHRTLPSSRPFRKLRLQRRWKMRYWIA